MEKKTQLHLIGNAHLDPVWLWQWQEGYAEIKATFRSALDRIKEFPDFIFTCACAAYYQWIEENAPEMFTEIQQRVAEGRWVIVGGWWIQPDCNLPSGESFARQGLYSQRYFLEKFGVMANVGYNVDSFGHHGMLPQILKKSGLDYYVFQRPNIKEKDLVNSLFWWESEDGTRVMTFRLPTGYTDQGPLRMEERILKHMDLSENEGNPVMSFYGVGNHGGGPTIAALLKLEELQKKYGEDKLVFSSPNAFFADVEQQNLDIPTLKEDLQLHAIGCYSAHSETKAYNRKAEHRLLTAEKFSALTHHILALPYPQEKLQHAWQLVMFNQFHDIMGGCSIKEAYEDSRESYGEALNISAVALNAALQKISWSIDTMLPEVKSLSKENDWMLWEQADLGIPLVVFNPLSWEVNAPIYLTTELTSITDETQKPIASQTIRASRTNGKNDKWGSMFIGRIPAMGYRVYWISKKKTQEKALPTAALTVSSTLLENDFIRVEFDPHNGSIVKLWDKRLELDIFNGKGVVAQIIDEYDSDTWSHELRAFPNLIGQFTDARFRILEQGPLRAGIRITSRYNQSVLQQDFFLYHDRADIEVKVQLDWREKHKMLKFAFPINAQQPEATYEIPYGYMVRPGDGEEKPGQQWVDISEANADGSKPQYGFALLNDSKYAYDVNGHILRMTVARGAIFADHFGYHHGSRDDLCEYMDQGIQQFKYTMVPHEGTWQEASIVKKAYELNVPPITIIETYHHGSLPQKMDGIHISNDGIIATVFKKAEDGNGYVLRCYESSGFKTDTTIEIPFLNRRWTATFGKCEILTFMIPDDATQPVRELNLLEM
ncbi:glycoside hydrolase family 38 C-terminal domain-containing protein [Bacillus sp. 3255]|uniref:alpha-mannosidase n=1 Tax=Bacillus sp. 3255 TaxID=2817904 RepID=UPI002854E531|nr:glycoside hydrolase family 38 C-terminal domain-containing protein [Bacillus sp. 3255]MDR6880790.1 alpha-mannosidase [Bacillus sp. 3255]